MKTNKRIISIGLLVALLLTAVPLGITVSATDSTTYQNTSELFSNELETIYATKGTPAIDGQKDDWAGAYSFTVTSLYNTNGTLSENCYVVYSVMWDENNLYLLEERPYDTMVYMGQTTSYNWGNVDGNRPDISCARIVLPTDVDAENGKYGADNLVFYGVADIAGKAAGTIGDSVRMARVAKFNGTVGEQTKENFNELTGEQAYLGRFSAIKSKTTKTETGYFIETSIPWNVLDEYDKSEFTATADTVIGFGLNITGVNNGGNRDNILNGSETKNFQKLQLVETNPTAEYIAPDFSWYSADATEWILEDEADLMGYMLLASGIGKSNPELRTKYGIQNSNDRNQSFVSNKTVKLAKDMDLNPGWKADGTGEKTLANKWVATELYKTVFDGQGHTVSGLSIEASSRRSGAIGFFAEITAGCTVQNLSLKNGTVKSVVSASTGSFAGTVHGCSETTTITVDHVYSDLSVESKVEGRVGGLIADTYGSSGTATPTLNMHDAVFAGKVAGVASETAENAIAFLIGRVNRDGNNFNVIVNCEDCYYIGSQTGLENYGFYKSFTERTSLYVQSKDPENGKYSIRLVKMIDESDLELKSVGFEVTLTVGDKTYQPKTMKTETVYKSILAAGKTVAASDKGYAYCYALVIENLPADKDVTVSVKPVYENADETPYNPIREQSITFPKAN